MRLHWIRKTSEAIFQTLSDADKLLAERRRQNSRGKTCRTSPVCWDSSTALASVWPGSTITDVCLRINRMVNTEITFAHLNALFSSWSRQHCWELWIRVRTLHIPAVSVISSLNPTEYLWEHVLAVCFSLHLYLIPSPPPHPWWVSRGERNHNFDGVLFFQ